MNFNPSLFFVMGLCFGAGLYIKKAHPVLQWVMFFPGVFLHEMSHYVTAALTLSKPSLPTLTPLKVKGGWVLGSVRFVPGWLTAAFVALSPFPVLFCFAVWILILQGSEQDYLISFGFGYLFCAVVVAMWPSSADWRIAVQYPLSLFFTIFFMLWFLPIPIRALFLQV